MTDVRPRGPIVALPFHDWRKGVAEGFRTRDGHLIQEFARRDLGPVVVIDRPVSRAERLARRVPLRVPGRLLWSGDEGSTRAWLTEAQPNVLVIDVATSDVLAPAAAPRRWWFDVFSRADVAALIGQGLESVDARHAPAIAWTPTVAALVEALEPRRLVFDSLDNWLIHPVLRRTAREAAVAYGRLLPRADAVFVAAPRSATVFRRWREDVEVLPNGVDPATFASPMERPADLPPGLVVGYAGKLAHRIDAELVEAVARRMPDLSFVFVGPVLDRRAVQGLRRVPNVMLIGDRHYDRLPAYVRHFDVSWIPHRVGEGESGGDPIKLYEYWAAGSPVVSTRIDGLERWAADLPMVADAEGAAAAIRQMLAHPRVPPVPADRTWRAIADRLLAALLPGPGTIGQAEVDASASAGPTGPMRAAAEAPL